MFSISIMEFVQFTPRSSEHFKCLFGFGCSLLCWNSVSCEGEGALTLNGHFSAIIPALDRFLAPPALFFNFSIADIESVPQVWCRVRCVCSLRFVNKTEHEFVFFFCYGCLLFDNLSLAFLSVSAGKRAAEGMYTICAIPKAAGRESVRQRIPSFATKYILSIH